MKQISISDPKDGTVRQRWTSDRVADAILVILNTCEVPDDTVSREEAEANRNFRVEAAWDANRYFVQLEARPGHWMTLQIADSVEAAEKWLASFKTRFSETDPLPSSLAGNVQDGEVDQAPQPGGQGTAHRAGQEQADKKPDAG